MQPSAKPAALLLLFAFIAIYFVWGTTYLAIVYALKGFGPFTISAIRYLAAGSILSCWLFYKKEKWPSGKDRQVLTISGILMLSGGSGLVVVGEKYISSGCAAVIVATEPLFFVLFDRWRWRSYFANHWIIAGLAIGFSGIAVFTYVAPPGATTHSHPLIGTLITLASAISWVIGALYANRNLSEATGTVSKSTVQLLAAGLLSGLIAGLKGELPALWLTAIPAIAWAGLAYMIFMGSLVAYLSFNWLITVQPPAVVSTHTFINPIIAVAMGWLLASEPVSGEQLIALVVVLAGVLITQYHKEKVKQT